MNKLKKWGSEHKLAVILTLAGFGLWIYTSNANFVFLAPAFLLAGIAFRAFPRTLIWTALGAYGALVMPNGWILAVAAALIIVVFLPNLRHITPMGDFGVRSKKENAPQRQR